MTDYQILTVIAAFIIVDIAVLSLVAIPLMRRRLAARIDKSVSSETPPALSLPSDPLGTASAGRLAAAIGTRPTLSAPVPTAIDLDELPIGALGAEIGENEVPGTVAPDVIEAIAAARAATEAGPYPTSVTTPFDDAQDEAQRMDFDRAGRRPSTWVRDPPRGRARGLDHRPVAGRTARGGRGRDGSRCGHGRGDGRGDRPRRRDQPRPRRSRPT